MHVAAVQSAPFVLHPTLQGELQNVVQIVPQPPEQVGPAPPVVCVMMIKGVVVVLGGVVPLIGNGVHGHGVGVIVLVFDGLGMHE